MFDYPTTFLMIAEKKGVAISMDEKTSADRESIVHTSSILTCQLTFPRKRFMVGA